MNAKFQRTARRDKKALLSEQCKEIEENNRTGKVRDLFKKIGDIKGTFHARMGSIKDKNGKDLARMGSIKDKNGKDLTEEEIKKRSQEYTQELYKQGLNDLDNHDGVVTHLELDILESEVKWDLRKITTKLVVVMEFQLSYF